MKIDIQHIAKLSRLKIAEGEAAKFEKEMENIVTMIQDLPQMDEQGALIDENNPMVLREDVAETLYRRDDLLKNAPQTQAGCVVVPKIVE